MSQRSEGSHWDSSDRERTRDGVQDHQERDDDERSRRGRLLDAPDDGTVPKLRGTHCQPPEASDGPSEAGTSSHRYSTLLHE